MSRPALFPASAIARIPIAPMRCADCGGPDCIIFVCDGPMIRPFCAPDCAAAYGVEPWRSSGLIERMSWSEPKTALGGTPAIMEI
jgi:hypothetical protein